MTQYLCKSCGILTHMKRHLEKAKNMPSADECPNCGEKDDFQYL